MSKPIFVAEFTTNHLGNLNLALQMARAAKAAGADYVKMQKKCVESFYSTEKLLSPYISPYGKAYLDYRRVFEFDREQFSIFDRYCKMINMPWFCTAQDIPSLEAMLSFNLPMYKIASSNARNWDFIMAVNDRVPQDKAVVLSVAGSTTDEIEKAVAILTSKTARTVFVLHCVAEYPCEPKHLRLGNIARLTKLFRLKSNVLVGYSGHEEGIDPSLIVADFGVAMIERHFCMSRHSFAHHIDCSLEPDEFARMVNYDLIAERKQLPDEAFVYDFGMSEIETSFLIDQTYGKKYLGEQSEWIK